MYVIGSSDSQRIYRKVNMDVTTTPTIEAKTL